MVAPLATIGRSSYLGLVLHLQRILLLIPTSYLEIYVLGQTTQIRYVLFETVDAPKPGKIILQAHNQLRTWWAAGLSKEPAHQRHVTASTMRAQTMRIP